MLVIWKRVTFLSRVMLHTLEATMSGQVYGLPIWHLLGCSQSRTNFSLCNYNVYTWLGCGGGGGGGTNDPNAKLKQTGGGGTNDPNAKLKQTGLSLNSEAHCRTFDWQPCQPCTMHVQNCCLKCAVILKRLHAAVPKLLMCSKPESMHAYKWRVCMHLTLSLCKHLTQESLQLTRVSLYAVNWVSASS